MSTSAQNSTLILPAETSPQELFFPLAERSQLLSLRAGDRVLLSGVVYAARDTAHKRMLAALKAGEVLPAANAPSAGVAGTRLPIDVHNALIYYVGPTPLPQPAPPGHVLGSAGPTTSSRMDSYTPALLAAGLAATLGKGKRSLAVRNALLQYGAVYFGATGGAAALLSRHIVAVEVLAYPELGTEAVRKLTFERFPALVLYDAHGGQVFAED